MYPYPSRNGREIRSPATWNGDSTESPIRWAACSEPPEDSRKYTVMSASETTTRTTATRRALNRPELREEEPPAPPLDARRTGSRAVRCLGTECQSLRRGAAEGRGTGLAAAAV